MDADKIRALRALCNEKGGLEWTLAKERNTTPPESGTEVLVFTQQMGGCTKIGRMNEEMPYIVAACNALPGLLDEIERINAKLTETEARASKLERLAQAIVRDGMCSECETSELDCNWPFDTSTGCPWGLFTHAPIAAACIEDTYNAPSGAESEEQT